MTASHTIRKTAPLATQTNMRVPPFDVARRPVAAGGNHQSGLLALLQLEAAAREADSPEVLHFLFANEAQKLTQSRQIFILSSVSNELRLTAVSGLPTVDRTAPLVRCIEGIISLLQQKTGLTDAKQFDFATYVDRIDPSFRIYPFQSLLWLPVLSRGRKLMGGILLARESIWTDQQIVIGKRLADTYAHALALLLSEAVNRPRFSLRSFANRKAVIGCSASALLILAFPVSMTTLAPFEIVAREPFVVAAPIDGAIRGILVDASAEVSTGQPLVQLADTVLRNRLEVAEREALVADARVKKSTQLAFEDARGRQELGLAIAELALKTTERDFARDMFEQATIKASRSGVAVFSDKQALNGKPVTVGERIMLIADPKQVEVAIDLSVSDAIALQLGARVKIFPDSDPLNSREAEIVAADYLARVRPGSALAFRVTAKLQNSGSGLPRLGTRGTAQLYGSTVSLGFYLFRRPLSALRQWIGL